MPYICSNCPFKTPNMQFDAQTSNLLHILLKLNKFNKTCSPFSLNSKTADEVPKYLCVYLNKHIFIDLSEFAYFQDKILIWRIKSLLTVGTKSSYQPTNFYQSSN